MKVITSKNDWTISGIRQLQHALSSNNKIQLTSTRFYNSDYPKVAWNLFVEVSSIESNRYASNRGREYGVINVWLCQMGPNGLNDLVNTKYRIYASVDGTNVDIARSTHKFENQEKLGYTQISLSKLLPSNGHSDSLFLRCDVEIDYYNSNDNLVNIYSGILEQETFTDCLVKIGNQIINTHRYILAQNSEVFYNMFKKNNGMIEAENSEVTISDTSPECFRAMLEFFYTGKINKSTLEKFVDDIFAIANKYQVELLKYECELFMASKIDVNNIVKYYNIIQLYGAPTLEKACKNYIQVNRNNFINSKEWKEIKDKYPELAIRSLEYVVNNSDNNNIIQQ